MADWPTADVVDQGWLWLAAQHRGGLRLKSGRYAGPISIQRLARKVFRDGAGAFRECRAEYSAGPDRRRQPPRPD